MKLPMFTTAISEERQVTNMSEHRLTPAAEEALRYSQEAAGELGHGYVGTEHLLLGLMRGGDGIARTALLEAGVTDEALVQLIRKNVGAGLPGGNPAQGLTPRARRVVEMAVEDAAHGGCGSVGAEHLLSALLREGSSVAVCILRNAGVDVKRLSAALMEKRSDAPRGRAGDSRPPAAREDGGRAKSLREFTRDLTAAARGGRLDPVIGRDAEIDRVIRILSRRTKNNPCLIGEPGVGKTAIAEGLARRLAAGNMPEELAGKRLLSLDIAGMVAGTKYRGEFEERVRKLMDEVRRAGDVILFIDELHTVVGAGSAEGAVDAANIIKPALGRGEIRCLGATTLDEYRKYIEKDAALERRFQPVQVAEPDRETALEILRGLRERYEAHHKLEITDEALEAAVRLSERYIGGRFLPDKAIDLMDEAASCVRMEEEGPSPERKALEEKLAELTRDKDAAIAAQDYETAARLRDIEQNYRRQLTEEDARRKARVKRRPVTADDIAAVVAGWTGIPVTRLDGDESRRLLDMEALLRARVVGQEEAVCAVARAIRRGRVGLKDPRRPTGSFLFLGPTGVGKTELSRALAEAVFGDEQALVRLDMSEYMERHAVSRLIGSPPGYVGHEEGGQLTEKVRRRPYCVVLFDEIEKAHEDVWNILLQILDDGRVTDAQGRVVDFRNTVVVMTGNVGAKDLTHGGHLGFSADGKREDGSDTARAKEAVMAELRRTFRPEFLNRIDDTVIFRPLSRADLCEVARRMLAAVAERMEAAGLRLEVSEAAVEALAREGFRPRCGARPLRRCIRDRVEDAVAEKLLDGTLQPGDAAKLCVEDGELRIEKDEPRTGAA